MPERLASCVSCALARVLSVALVCAVAIASPAAALELFDDGERSLDLRLLVRAGIGASGPADQTLSPEPNLALLRMMLKTEIGDYADGYLQFDAASSSPRMLDAYARVRPIEQLEFRAGQYRPPVGLLFHVTRSRVPFDSRARISRIVLPRAPSAHMALLAKHTLAGSQLDIGLSQDARSVGGDPYGVWFNTRAQVRPIPELLVHVAFAEAVRGQMQANGHQDWAASRMLDLGLGVDHPRFFGRLELVRVFHDALGPDLLSDAQAGVVPAPRDALGAFIRIPINLPKEGMALTPVLALDMVENGQNEAAPEDRRDETEWAERLRMGLELELRGRSVLTAVTWEHEWPAFGAAQTNGIYANLQVDL